jgi:hypothetical protein
MSYYEYLEPGTQLRVSIGIALEWLQEANETRLDWVDLDSRFLRLFGVARAQLQDEQEMALVLLRRSLDGLCRLAEDTVADDLAWARRVGNSGVGLPGFLEFLKSLQGDGIPIRPGWFGLTPFRLLDLWLYRHQPALLEEFPAERWQSFWPRGGEAGDPPMVRRLMNINSQAWPMGWCMMEMAGVAPERGFQMPEMGDMPAELQKPLPDFSPPSDRGGDSRARGGSGRDLRRVDAERGPDSRERDKRKPNEQREGQRPRRPGGLRDRGLGGKSRGGFGGGSGSGRSLKTPWGEPPKLKSKHGRGKGSGASKKGKK